METVCLPSVTQCSERDVAFGFARKESSLRLKLVILLQEILVLNTLTCSSLTLFRPGFFFASQDRGGGGEGAAEENTCNSATA